MRLEGERRARLSLIRLVAVVSILRTALTQVLPLAGSASWWLLPVCLLPGLAIYFLLRGCMRRIGVRTLTDAVRAGLSRPGVWLLCAAVTATLLVDGTASMTALITLFTEGIGTQGTQLTLALLTSGVLLFCLSREGLPRGIYLLRWLMLVAAAVLAVNGLLYARLDHLFPWMGDGSASVMAALRTGISIGWPVVLLLLAEPVRPEGRQRGLFLPLLLSVAAVGILCLSRPHELLTNRQDLSGALLQLMDGLQSAVVTLGQCLLMLVLFLTVGAAAHLLTDSIAAPMGQPPMWLPYAVVVALTLTQCTNIRALWRTLSLCQPWLLAPYGLIALLLLLTTTFRRKRT